MKVAIMSEFPDYVISDSGRIQGPHSWIKPAVTAKGYHRISVYRDGKLFNKYVHVLVCTAFYGDRPSPRHQVRHRDGNPANNQLSNLCWGTPEENWADRIKHGHRAAICGEDHHAAKFTWREVRELRRDYAEGAYSSHQDAANSYGVRRETVSKILRNESWKEA